MCISETFKCFKLAVLLTAGIPTGHWVTMNNETEIAQALYKTGCNPLSPVLVSEAFKLPADLHKSSLKDILHSPHFSCSAKDFPIFSPYSLFPY